MDYDIEFKRTLDPPNWVDNVDRVTAGGENGFNVQFQSLADDLDTLGARIADINAAVNDSRRELYTGMRALAEDGAARVDGTALGFLVSVLGDLNDFRVRIGPGFVGGRPIVPAGSRLYSKQRWIDPVKAAEDGVATIPLLTVPTEVRSDLVYADVWEHEAGRAQNPSTVGAPRIERETAIRVAEGATTLPTASADHTFMLIAVLHRRANGVEILQSEIEDRRVFVDQSSITRILSLQPVFHPVPQFAPWINNYVNFAVVAQRSASTGLLTSGFLPLFLPHRARMTSLTFRGNHSVTGSGTASLTIYLARTLNDDPGARAGKVIARDTVLGPGGFDRIMTIQGQDENLDLVDNNSFLYWIWADSSGSSSTTVIHGLALRYIF